MEKVRVLRKVKMVRSLWLVRYFDTFGHFWDRKFKIRKSLIGAKTMNES
jgi:hypothetical protein